MDENKRRRSHRLHNFDYSQRGAYFVTIVAFDRACLFGVIKNGVMFSNAFGDIACWEWECLPKRFPFVQVDEFNVMPNHTHAIILNNGDRIKAKVERPMSNQNGILVGAR